jgi:hypothetical protein
MAINPLQQPIDYFGAMPQVDIGKQFAEFGQVLAERQKRTQAEEVKAAYKTDLQAVLDNPSMKAFNDFSLKYPQQREVIKDVAQRFTQEQQDSEFNIGRDVAIALENDKPEVALEILNQTIDAREKSKLPIGVYGQVQQILLNTDDPDRLKKAKAQTNFALTLLNPEKFSKAVESLEKQKLAPSVLSKSVADAQESVAKAEIKVAEAGDTPTRLNAEKQLREALVKEAKVKAKYAEQLALADIKKKSEPSKPLVSVTVENQSKRDELALSKLDIPRAEEFSASAASARTLARDARVIANLLKGKGGGAVIKLGADIAKTFGFSTDTVVANDLANSLAVRGATQIRAPGSGSTSDLEFKSFVSAFPSLANSEGGRELMAKYADAFAKRSAKIADHARKLIRDDKYSEEEIARFDESLGSILDKDFYESVNTGPRVSVPKYVPPAASAAPAAAPRTLDFVLELYAPKKK